jgi:Glycopeptide antibiotics resistance protein
MEKNTATKIRVGGIILFVLYLLGLVYFLFFAENYGRTILREDYQYNLRPFKEIMRFIEYREEVGTMAFLSNMFGNVIGFIPLGLIFPIINKRARNFFFIVMISFEFSLLVETVQLVFKVGSFDVDDLILNTLGGMLGYLLFYISNKIRRRYYG